MTIQIDLAGPEGNAFAMIGMAIKICKQAGLEKPEIDAITADMRSGNYHHLLNVFEREFKDFGVEFENDPRETGA